MISELQAPPAYQTVFEEIGKSQSGTAQFFAVIGGGMKGSEFFAPGNLEAVYRDAGTPPERRVYPGKAS
jgi:hypothetical protein